MLLRKSAVPILPAHFLLIYHSFTLNLADLVPLITTGVVSLDFRATTTGLVYYRYQNLSATDFVPIGGGDYQGFPSYRSIRIQALEHDVNPHHPDIAACSFSSPPDVYSVRNIVERNWCP